MAGGPAIPVLFALSTAPDFETGITRMAQFKTLFGPMQFVVSRSTSDFAVRVTPNAFQRAFRKWTGMTPRSLRSERAN